MLPLLVVGIEFSPAHVLYTGPILTATPALAAVATGPKGATWAAGAALAVSVATATYNEAWGSQQVYTNFLAILLVSMASIMLSRATRRHRQSELEQVRRISMAAQRVVLRPLPSRLGPVRVASRYDAAERGALIGGDLYEAVQTRYGIRLIVGDVRGKGLPAVHLAAAVLGAFREAVHYEDELVEVMNHCAAALHRERTAPGVEGEEDVAGQEEMTDQDVRDDGGVSDEQAEDFVTALVAQVPDRPDRPVVHVVNRGHLPPLVLHEGKVQALTAASPQPPLGLEDLVSSTPAKAESFPFVPGDRLLLYTDGVIEARNRDNEYFALPQAMEAVDACTPPDFLAQLHQDLIRHTEGFMADDVAMMLVDRLDGDSVGAEEDEGEHVGAAPADDVDHHSASPWLHRA